MKKLLIGIILSMLMLSIFVSAELLTKENFHLQGTEGNTDIKGVGVFHVIETSALDSNSPTGVDIGLPEEAGNVWESIFSKLGIVVMNLPKGNYEAWLYDSETNNSMSIGDLTANVIGNAGKTMAKLFYTGSDDLSAYDDIYITKNDIGITSISGDIVAYGNEMPSIADCLELGETCIENSDCCTGNCDIGPNEPDGICKPQNEI